MKPTSEYGEYEATAQIYDSFGKDCRAMKLCINPMRKRGDGKDDDDDEESGNGGGSPSKRPRSCGGSPSGGPPGPPFEGPAGYGGPSAGTSAGQYTAQTLPYKPIGYSA